MTYNCFPLVVRLILVNSNNVQVGFQSQVKTRLSVLCFVVCKGGDGEAGAACELQSICGPITLNGILYPDVLVFSLILFCFCVFCLSFPFHVTWQCDNNAFCFDCRAQKSWGSWRTLARCIHSPTVLGYVVFLSLSLSALRTYSQLQTSTHKRRLVDHKQHKANTFCLLHFLLDSRLCLSFRFSFIFLSLILSWAHASIFLLSSQYVSRRESWPMTRCLSLLVCSLFMIGFNFLSILTIHLIEYSVSQF